MVTGTSVLGVKFNGGVIIAADMLGSYGSLARFRNISRLMKVTRTPTPYLMRGGCGGGYDVTSVCLSFSGEQQHHPGRLGRLRRLPVHEAGHRADGVSWSHTAGDGWYQTVMLWTLTWSLCSVVGSIDEELLGDGHSYSPKAIHSWLTRVMYNRRSKMNPLWNTVVIGGFYNGER